MTGEGGSVGYSSVEADLLEERAQRRELGEALVRVTEERDEARRERDNVAEDAVELARDLRRLGAERDEARDEVVRLGREREQLKAGVAEAARQLGGMRVKVDQLDRMIAEYTARTEAELVRLRTIIGELGAAEAAEPQEQIEALRPEADDGH